MSDHSSFQNTASKLIQKNGRSAVLTLKMAVAGAEPWEPAANVEVPLTVKMLIFPTVMKDDKGTVIPGNFQRVYVSSIDLEAEFQAWLEVNAPSMVGDPMPKITTKDTITDSGREYQIVRPSEVKPGDQSILFDMTVAG